MRARSNRRIVGLSWNGTRFIRVRTKKSSAKSESAPRSSAGGLEQSASRRICDDHRSGAVTLRHCIDVLLFFTARRDVRALESDGTQQLPTGLETGWIECDGLSVRADRCIDLCRFGATALVPIRARIPVLIAVADLRGEWKRESHEKRGDEQKFSHTTIVWHIT